MTILPETQMKALEVGCDDILSKDELAKKLERSYKQQKPLIVKFGADPSRPDLHLGHTVVLQKLKKFQDFGHTIKFIIGDFTARIGDPTGKSKTRPQLSTEEVDDYAKTYKEQIFKILDPKRTDVVYNSHWLAPLTPMDFIRLMASRTVQQLLARDDFATRYQEQTPIFMHEFIYPMLQGYDSIILKADVELGGVDQRFNLLFARDMQKQAGLEPQSIVMTPILEGLDGVQKMSKSLDNYISLSDTPKDMFGKTMSISDKLMIRFYELLSAQPAEQLEALKHNLRSGTLHPMEAKKNLAQEIVACYWGQDTGEQERTKFESQFSRGELPDGIPSVDVTLDPQGLVDILALSVRVGFSASKSEARRILTQKGFKLDDAPLTQDRIPLTPGQSYLLRQGKLKWLKLQVR